jgi:ABC-type transport system involved in cytochrome c biogenesis permease subunit
MADNLVYLGFALLTLGLLFGALWAKKAWGNYWTWDPKETWALLTWLGYLVYIHYRFHQPQKIIFPLWILSLAFLILLVAWFGINYLPSAQNSVHVYSN